MVEAPGKVYYLFRGYLNIVDIFIFGTNLTLEKLMCVLNEYFWQIKYIISSLLF
jgi:hypothetical protein